MSRPAVLKGLSKRNPEVAVPSVGWGLLDAGITNVAGKGVMNLLDAVVNVLGWPLDKHLDRSVGQISHEAGYVVAPRDIVGRVPKSHALNVPFEDDMPGCLTHV